MSQIVTKFLADLAVTSGSSAAHGKIGSGAASATQALFSDGAGGTTFRSIISTDLPGSITSNTTGTASNITATTNTTLTTLSALTTATSLAISGSQVSGGTFGAINGSALTNLSAANLSGVLPVGVTGGSGLSIATTQLTGVLPIANGGTDNGSLPVTAGGVLYTDGTKFQNVGAGTSGQVLTSNGASAPTWTAASSGTVTSVSVVSTNGFAGTVATATTTPAITIETTLTTPVLAGNGTALIAATTTGTGSTVVLNADPTFATINMNSTQINNLANGTASGDAVNLGQLQAAISGLTWKGPVAAYAVGNVPLTGSTPLVIDGYTVLNGDMLLLAGQSTASQDGEYTAAITGGTYTLTANGQPTAAGDAWLVLNGTVYADSAFVANSAVPTATFTEFAGPTAYTFTAPLVLTGRTVTITQATTSTNGYLSSTDWNTFNNKQAAGNYITALTGDATASGPGSAALTLATVNSNVGSFGSSTSIPSFTVNAKGLITAASGNAVVAPAGTLSGTTLNSTVVSSSLTSVGTIATGVWQGTAVGPTFGGTGLTSYTTGDTLYASASNVLSKLAIGSTGNVLTVAGGVPTWAAPAATSTNNKETFVVAGSQQTFTLAHTPLTNSVSFLVQGGGDQLEGSSYDFTVSGAVVTLQNGLATGGVSALVNGDVVQIQYQY
jgi:hypothetical protein